MNKVFVDTDIIIDLLAQREPHYQFSASLFSLVDLNKIKAYTSPIIISNIHFILSRILNKNKSIKSIQKLNSIISILPVDQKIIDLSLASDFKDFEDAIQYYCALNGKISSLLTRNIKDYKLADIEVLTAEEYLNIYHTGDSKKSEHSK